MHLQLIIAETRTWEVGGRPCAPDWETFRCVRARAARFPVISLLRTEICFWWQVLYIFCRVESASPDPARPKLYYSAYAHACSFSVCVRMYFQPLPMHVFPAFSSVCIFSYRPSMYSQRLPTHVCSAPAPVRISSICPRMFCSVCLRMYFQRVPIHVFSAAAHDWWLMDSGVPSACFSAFH